MTHDARQDLYEILGAFVIVGVLAFWTAIVFLVCGGIR